MAHTTLLALALLVALAASQSVRTQNGTLLLEIGGATLALSGQTSCAAGAGGGAGSTLATQADVNAAIANSLQQTQPQITNALNAVNASEGRLTSLVQTLVGSEQSRAVGVSNALSVSIAQEASRAVLAETQISSAVAGAVTAGQMLSQSVATLLANDQLRLNTTLATLAAALGGQLQAWQTIINPQLSSLGSSISSLNSTFAPQLAGLSSGLSSEISRSALIDVQQSTAIAGEISRAVFADSSLATATSTLVTAEQTRASTVESALSTSIATERSRILNVQANLTSAIAAEIQRAVAVENALNATTIGLTNAVAQTPVKRVIWQTSTAGSYQLLNIIDTARFTTGWPTIGLWNCVLRSNNGAHWSGYMFTVAVSIYYCTSTYTPNVGGHCTSIFNSIAASASTSGCGSNVFTSWSGSGSGAFSFAPGACVQSITLTCTSLD